MEITNLGHASFLIKGDNISLVVDPYRDDSVPGLRFPRVSANYAFKSHDHHDHDALDLVKKIPTDVKVDVETITVPHDKQGGLQRGLNLMHIFNIDGLKIIHTGDLGCIPTDKVLDKMKGADIIFAPINGFYTISAEELCAIVQIVRPKLVVAMHYYKQSDNSGYPDGGQIERFKKYVGTYFEVNEPTVKVDADLLNKKVLIFNKALQEK